ncbi:MAG: peptide chain release factor N(5)-glutamine methyltransferase [Saccharofermentanales bacterium]
MREALISLDGLLNECSRILEPVFGGQAADEASDLITEITGINRLCLRARHDDIIIEPSERARVIEACRRRAGREPVRYITGKAYFMYDEFAVGQGVLIPRNDTGCLVEHSVDAAAEIFHREYRSPMPVRFLEFCTGSGCISVSFIKAALRSDIPVRGTATDISSIALEFADRNARNLGVADMLDIISHDLLSGDFTRFNANEAQYDIIICNPPYIRSGVIPFLEPDVRDYEPHLALDGGEDGLMFYRALAGEASELLGTGGYMLVEIGYDQADEVQAIFRNSGRYGKIDLFKDYSGHPRVVRAHKA